MLLTKHRKSMLALVNHIDMQREDDRILSLGVALVSLARGQEPDGLPAHTVRIVEGGPTTNLHPEVSPLQWREFGAGAILSAALWYRMTSLGVDHVPVLQEGEEEEFVRLLMTDEYDKLLAVLAKKLTTFGVPMIRPQKRNVADALIGLLEQNGDDRFSPAEAKKIRDALLRYRSPSSAVRRNGSGSLAP